MVHLIFCIFTKCSSALKISSPITLCKITYNWTEIKCSFKGSRIFVLWQCKAIHGRV